jgi:hypothetical protein
MKMVLVVDGAGVAVADIFLMLVSVYPSRVLLASYIIQRFG